MRRQKALKGLVILFQALEVGRPASRIANRVQLEPQIAEAKPLQPITRQLNYLDVERGTGATDRLHVKLEKLPVAALLRAVVPKHRSQQIKTRRLGILVETMFEVGPDNAGGRLWSECNPAPTAVCEAVKLFGKRVAVVAGTPDQLGRPDGWGGNFLLAEPARHFLRGTSNGTPEPPVGRQKA